jgi:hypothetical protein
MILEFRKFWLSETQIKANSFTLRVASGCTNGKVQSAFSLSKYSFWNFSNFPLRRVKPREIQYIAELTFFPSWRAWKSIFRIYIFQVYNFFLCFRFTVSRPKLPVLNRPVLYLFCSPSDKKTFDIKFKFWKFTIILNSLLFKVRSQCAPSLIYLSFFANLPPLPHTTAELIFPRF